MPLETTHLTALHETTRRLGATARRIVAGGHRTHAAELGAVWIDLPYLEHLSAQIARHLVHAEPLDARWATRAHVQAPIELLHAVVRAAADARHEGADVRGEARAFALGLASHLVVDRVVHPLVNWLAGDEPEEHTRVEKLQNAIFHERCLGGDVVGTLAYADLAAIDLARGLAKRPLVGVVRRATAEVLGEAPTRSTIARWARGYRGYVAIFASPLGALAVPRSARVEAYDRVYAGAWGSYEELLDLAIRASVAPLDALADVLDGAPHALADATVTRALGPVLAPGTVDPPGDFFVPAARQSSGGAEGKTRKSAGTWSVSHTPFAERMNA